MTEQEMRAYLIEIIRKEPMSLASIAREMGISGRTIAAFLAGHGVFHFKSLIKIGNWVEMKRMEQS